MNTTSRLPLAPTSQVSPFWPDRWPAPPLSHPAPLRHLASAVLVVAVPALLWSWFTLALVTP